MFCYPIHQVEGGGAVRSANVLGAGNHFQRYLCLCEEHSTDFDAFCPPLFSFFDVLCVARG